MPRLFVYGTLKQGFGAHGIIERSGGTFVRKAKTTGGYRLMTQRPRAFPCMVPAESDTLGVQGEVYEIPEGRWGRLDSYEGVSHGLFKRVEVELDDGERVFAYIYGNEDEADRLFTELPDGVWT